MKHSYARYVKELEEQAQDNEQRLKALDRLMLQHE